jgi:hypothetical protein
MEDIPMSFQESPKGQIRDKAQATSQLCGVDLGGRFWCARRDLGDEVSQPNHRTVVQLLLAKARNLGACFRHRG